MLNAAISILLSVLIDTGEVFFTPMTYCSSEGSIDRAGASHEKMYGDLIIDDVIDPPILCK